ncbi:hypothetical protein DCAR_0206052 [Daucus carota subsp. sativus]|uniref:Uncharacterized protein n=1 Tax=Daucus carota subsp. sativus TaxID=79200 RepID=A0A166D0A0_DAUCS|nr:hypothetical protein DCAR_0206052 [Daucus carota subsp. sativus]
MVSELIKSVEFLEGDGGVGTVRLVHLGEATELSKTSDSPSCTCFDGMDFKCFDVLKQGEGFSRPMPLHFSYKTVVM